MERIPYSRQCIDGNDKREVVRALGSDWITQGPYVRKFEKSLSRYTGARYVVAVSGGTPALHLSMLALGISRGDEVITSPITFSASANCALYVGARPRFIDIDDDTYQLDIEKLKNFLKAPSRRKRVKALIGVHFMGMPLDMPEIKKICDRYGIKIIEDAAHALGAKYRYRDKWYKVGGCGHSRATMFSFHAIKHITTGEGGAILTNDKRIYEAAARLRHHGIVKSGKGLRLWSYDIPQIGFNYRITDFQCALGNSQLKRLDSMVRDRREMAGIYNDGLSNIREIRLPHERDETHSSYHLYVVRVAMGLRDRLYGDLRKAGILAQVNYIPVHLLSYYRKRYGYRLGDLPVAERYFKECLSLPLYIGLTRNSQQKIIKRIRRFFKR